MPNATPNAILTCAFPHAQFTFEATWAESGIAEAEDIAESIFFGQNPDIAQAFDSGGYPDLDIALLSKPAIRSRVAFDDMAGMVFPTRPLSQSTAKALPLPPAAP